MKGGEKMDFLIQPMEIGGELSSILNGHCITNKRCPNTNCVAGCACPVKK